MGLNGLEPATSRLSGVRSNHLSYRPTTGARGLEPPTFGFGDRRSTTELCPFTDQEESLNQCSTALTNAVYQKKTISARKDLFFWANQRLVSNSSNSRATSPMVCKFANTSSSI